MIKLLHYTLYPLLPDYINLIHLILLVNALPKYPKQRLTLLAFLVNELDFIHRGLIQHLDHLALRISALVGVLYVSPGLRIALPHLNLNLKQQGLGLFAGADAARAH